MSTLNHDTELEALAMNIVFQIGDLFSDFGDRATRDAVVDIRQSTNDKAIDFTKKLINTYLYKQTLELIGPDINTSHTTHDACPTCMRAVVQNQLKKQLRKAAAERWGQE